MRFITALMALLTASALAAADSASPTGRTPACDVSRLSFALPQPSPPMQSQAVGFSVYNMGVACRLALPVGLKLAHHDGGRLRVRPSTSRLTLRARALRRYGSASVIWTYENYCGRHAGRARPILYTVTVAGIELRARGGAAPCQARGAPVEVRVLFACPTATGPAIDAILPRPLPLCR